LLDPNLLAVPPRSMVVDDEAVLNRLMKAVCEAAAATNQRVLMQSSWAKFDPRLCSDRVFVSLGGAQILRKIRIE